MSWMPDWTQENEKRWVLKFSSAVVYIEQDDQTPEWFITCSELDIYRQSLDVDNDCSARIMAIEFICSCLQERVESIIEEKKKEITKKKESGE